MVWACTENGRKWNSQKGILYVNLRTTRLRGRSRNRWQDEVREDGEYLVEKGGRKKFIREEWKKLLRTARNHHI